MAEPAYKRILLKLSGEMLAGNDGFGISQPVIERFADEVKAVHELGVEVALVIGGGNIFRGIAGESKGMDRAHADYMGMLATVINALAFQDALEQKDVKTRVMSAIPMERIAEPYIRRRAERHLEKGRVVIFAAGTGNPYFSTDTAAALRAMEIHADALCKATKVDGVYDSDPKKNPEAKFFPRMTFDEFITQKIGVMDTTAVTLCRDNKLPIRVFKLAEHGNVERVLRGEDVGTVIENG